MKINNNMAKYEMKNLMKPGVKNFDGLLDKKLGMIKFDATDDEYGTGDKVQLSSAAKNILKFDATDDEYIQPYSNKF